MNDFFVQLHFAYSLIISKLRPNIYSMLKPCNNTFGIKYKSISFFVNVIFTHKSCIKWLNSNDFELYNFKLGFWNSYYHIYLLFAWLYVIHVVPALRLLYLFFMSDTTMLASFRARNDPSYVFAEHSNRLKWPLYPKHPCPRGGYVYIIKWLSIFMHLWSETKWSRMIDIFRKTILHIYLCIIWIHLSS